jgi:hypothetical protein
MHGVTANAVADRPAETSARAYSGLHARMLRNMRCASGKRSGRTTEQVLALPGFRDRCTDASSAVYEDRRLAVRDDHPLDRQLRDPLE